MRKSRSVMTGVFAAMGMLVLILDSRTALEGAAQGVDLCVRSVIPALFPFFVLSAVLTGAFIGTENPVFKPLGRLCGIPQGAESILLAGLLGGYPVGAQCISQAYRKEQLSKEDARRMLGFCSNAGPAFLFGMSSALFQSKIAPFILWLIHILSALITGAVLPCKYHNHIRITPGKQVPASQAFNTAIRSAATVCGWVILFRVVLCFLDRWFLWLLPNELQILITGVLELTNGYLDLAALESEQLRFIYASILLAFGGFCVVLQTASILGQAGLDMGFYFPGKLLQTAISAVLSYIASACLFRQELRIPLLLVTAIPLLTVISLVLLKNSSSIPAASGV